jgi:hypothetical protein
MRKSGYTLGAAIAVIVGIVTAILVAQGGLG